MEFLLLYLRFIRGLGIKQSVLWLFCQHKAVMEAINTLEFSEFPGNVFIDAIAFGCKFTATEFPDVKMLNSFMNCGC
jgi:hypothetical protein